MRRIIDGGEPASQAARALDIQIEMLRSWTRQLKSEAADAGKQRKAFRVTTKSNYKKPIAPNLLDRKFSPQDIANLGRVLVGDISYIRTQEGLLHLAVLLDLFSR